MVHEDSVTCTHQLRKNDFIGRRPRGQPLKWKECKRNCNDFLEDKTRLGWKGDPLGDVQKI